MKHFILFLLVASNFTAYTCNCGKTDLASLAKKAQTIFSGRAVKQISNDSTNVYYFLPDKVWKGEGRDSMVIRFPLTADTCQMTLPLHQRYVIFAVSDFSSSCYRNEQLPETRDSIYLELLFNKPFGTSLGAVAEHKLSDEESSFLNVILNSQQYDFTGKKVIFFDGKFPTTKQKYFGAVRKTMDQDEQLIILTKEEQKQFKIDALVLINNQKSNAVTTRDTYLTILKMGKY